MGPLRGDGNRLILNGLLNHLLLVEKMGPLRGDGNYYGFPCIIKHKGGVEKMGPLRGDGNPRIHRFLAIS